MSKWEYVKSANVLDGQVIVANVGGSKGVDRMVLSSYKQHEAGIGPLVAAAPELLALSRDCLNLFETYVMQDMEPKQLKAELDPEVYDEVMEQWKHIKAVIAKAEGRE